MALTTYEQLRLCHVRRWHIVQTHREQTVAEHSYAVAVLDGSLAAAMRWRGLLHHTEQLRLLQWALSHDMMEVKTGDTPTPFKRALESVAGPGIVEKAEDAIDRDTAGAYRMVKGSEIEMIVKLADSIEAIQFLLDNGAGDHSRRVLDGLYETLFVQIRDFEVKYTTLPVYDAVRSVCKELNI